ncbi:MAG: hypothetical protein JXA14_07635 [Anaerolineae bacterium]|nr:hypothetical protein [Anaerolineae bacterium]
MAEQKRPSRVFVMLIAVAILMGGAGLVLGINQQNPQVVPAEELLPDLAGYSTVEGERLTDYIGKLSGGAALLAGQPELALAIAAVDQVIDCYQEVGAVKARAYSNQDAPLSAGIVAVGDRNELLEPANLFKCVAPAIPDGSQPDMPPIQMCSDSYILVHDGNEFYIIYAGTTEEICATFCAALEGCEEHE